MARSSKISHRALLLGAALLALGAAQPALADVKAGVDAWERGEFERAIAEWREPAANGDADAQFNLGQAYKLGRGVPTDLKMAESWYKKAADRGHVQAADNYGLVLFQDNRREEAMPYIRASSARGEPRAQYVLGTAMFNGDIAPKDWVQAYALMTRASAQGLPQASRSLATMDKYIPMADRAKGTQLAAEMERSASAERQKLAGAAAGLAPAVKPVATAGKPATQPRMRPGVRPPASSTIQTTSLPPSSVGGTVTPPAPANPTSVAASAGVDFGTIGATPSAARPAAAPPPPAPAPSPLAAVASTAPAAAANGDWRVQLGAFSEEGRARSLWSALEQKNGSLAGLQSYLVKAGAITKLQAGPFASQAAAKQVCAAVARTGQACFPVKR